MSQSADIDASENRDTSPEKGTNDCYGCFWEMRPGPWHTCVNPPVVGRP